MKTAIVVIMVLVLILAGAGLFFAPQIREQLSSMSRPAAGTPVRLEAAQARPLVETISAPGDIEPHTKVDISAQVVGEVIDLPFREGEEVKRGDLVVKIDDRDLQAALLGTMAAHESALANLESIKAARERSSAQLREQINRHKGLQTTLEFARRTLERRQALFDSGDIAQADLDQSLERVRDIESQIDGAITIISAAENTLASSDAQIRQAEASVRQAAAEIERTEEAIRNTTIYSPIDGRVTRLNAEVGETVMTGTMNNPGTVIMTIADLSRMRMQARVAESDVTRIAEGQTANIFIIGHGEESFRGVVNRIALQRTAAPDGTGHFLTEIDLLLEGRALRSGHTANVDIEIRRHEGLVVPSQAVVDRIVEDLPPEVLASLSAADTGKRVIRVVYRVVDGKVEAVPVEVGASDTTHTLIRVGLNGGDQVVTGPYKVLDTIKHGTAVRDMMQDEAAKRQPVGAAAERADTGS